MESRNQIQKRSEGSLAVSSTLAYQRFMHILACSDTVVCVSSLLASVIHIFGR